MKSKILVVLGPTASGKTALALRLARRFGGALIAADSMQVYRELVIGTAATTPEEAGDVSVHLSGFLPPEETFSVADWTSAAHAAIGETASKGNLPVLCGGTGLYVQSFVDGISFAEEPQDAALRQRLYREWDEAGGQAMLARLAALDPARAQRLHPADQKRILRALELSLLTGQTAQRREAASRPQAPPYNALLLGLRFARRADLYEAINTRVDAMMQAGLLQEARGVWENRARYKTAAQAIGYKEFFPYFEGRADAALCVEKLKQATRNYAKRQMTWFGRMEAVHWLDAQSAALAEQAEELVAGFL